MQLSKIELIYNALDMNDTKAAMKIFAKESEKSAKKINKDPAQKAVCHFIKASIVSSCGNLKQAKGLFNDGIAEVKNIKTAY
jgi:signal recognition particle GTPase